MPAQQRAAGLSATVISDLENGRAWPDVMTVVNVARALGIAVVGPDVNDVPPA